MKNHSTGEYGAYAPWFYPVTGHDMSAVLITHGDNLYEVARALLTHVDDHLPDLIEQVKQKLRDDISSARRLDAAMSGVWGSRW